MKCPVWIVSIVKRHWNVLGNILKVFEAVKRCLWFKLLFWQEWLLSLCFNGIGPLPLCSGEIPKLWNHFLHMYTGWISNLPPQSGFRTQTERAKPTTIFISSSRFWSFIIVISAMAVLFLFFLLHWLFFFKKTKPMWASSFLESLMCYTLSCRGVCAYILIVLIAYRHWYLSELLFQWFLIRHL